MLIDLQLHSTYSDGYLTPTKLADFLLKNKILIASLTDHNTVAGLDEFRRACKKNKIKVITGLEVYARLNHKKFNLLWYNFDDSDPELHDFLRFSQIKRRNQTRQALIKLKNVGFKLDENKILDKYNHYIPLNHVISDIQLVPENQKKITAELHNQNPREEEIIHYFFKNKNIVRLDEYYVNFSKILRLRKKIGGQLVLNHPAKSRRIDIDLISLLKKLDLDGLEVLSPHHDMNAVMRLEQIANNLKLIMTGGSDYHLDEGWPSNIKNIYSYFKIETKYLNNIDKIIN